MKNFLYHLLLFFQKLFTPHDTHLHNARFARDYELVSLSHDKPHNSGLLLGVDRFNRVLSVESTEARQELGHLGIFGPSRSGKTIREEQQLRQWKYSIIVNDIKHELSDKTAEIRAKYGPVFFLDPSGGVGHQYDPLDGVYNERQLYKLAYHLLYDPNEKETVFTERATKMLTQLFLAARIVGERSLPYVGRVVNFGLNGVARILNTISPPLAAKFLDAEYKANHDFEEDRFRSSAWATLSARLYFLLTEDIVRCFNGSDFKVKDLLFLEKPLTIFLRWHESDLLSLSPLIKFVWESMINELITAYDLAPDKKKCRKVLLDIEEAGRTGIPNLPEHSSTVNGRNISITSVWQSRSQAYALYGKYRAEVLFNNMDSQIYYRQADLETAQKLEERLGYKSGYASSHTEHEGKEMSNGKVEQKIPLMSVQEIMQMSDDEIIGFHRGLPPFRAQRIPPAKEHKDRAALKLPLLPPLAERLPDPLGQRPEPLTSWHFAPDLFRRWSPTPVGNELKKQGTTNGKGWV